MNGLHEGRCVDDGESMEEFSELNNSASAGQCNGMQISPDCISQFHKIFKEAIADFLRLRSGLKFNANRFQVRLFAHQMRPTTPVALCRGIEV